MIKHYLNMIIFERNCKYIITDPEAPRRGIWKEMYNNEK